jgi:hypothetical protein
MEILDYFDLANSHYYRKTLSGARLQPGDIVYFGVGREFRVNTLKDFLSARNCVRTTKRSLATKIIVNELLPYAIQPEQFEEAMIDFDKKVLYKTIYNELLSNQVNNSVIFEFDSRKAIEMFSLLKSRNRTDHKLAIHGVINMHWKGYEGLLRLLVLYFLPQIRRTSPGASISGWSGFAKLYKLSWKGSVQPYQIFDALRDNITPEQFEIFTKTIQND